MNARRRPGMPRTLPGQLALIAAAAAAPMIAGLIVLSVLMLVSDHAVVLVIAVLAGAGILAVPGTWMLSRSLTRDLEALRGGLEAVGDGARDVTITASANQDTVAAAAAANLMIAQLGAEEAARSDSEAARHDLIAAVSHDLRTPMTSLRLLADAVGDDILEEERRRSYLDGMRTHIDALTALIDDLFELSRLQAGDVDWPLERVRLTELVDETVEAMRLQAQTRGVDVATRLSEPAAVARANPEKLQRVLFNLLDNAIRHTPADGSVVVHTRSLDEQIELEVVDSGEGIPDADRERVFEAFQRGAADSARGDGAGLGLAVSRAIVEAHGGRIWVAPSARGTSVRVRLPAARG